MGHRQVGSSQAPTQHTPTRALARVPGRYIPSYRAQPARHPTAMAARQPCAGCGKPRNPLAYGGRSDPIAATLSFRKPCEDKRHVHIPRALHRRQLGQAHRQQEAGRDQSRQQQADRRAGPRLQGRPGQGARRRRQGLQDLAPGFRLRARQDPAQGRRIDARPRRRDRQGAHPGAGQDPGRIQDGGAERRRHRRLVRRRGPARLRPHHPGPRRRRAQHGDPGADRPGRRLLAVELPGHAGGAQDRRVAGGGLLDHHQVPRGDAGLADRPRQVLP